MQVEGGIPTKEANTGKDDIQSRDSSNEGSGCTASINSEVKIELIEIR